MSKHVTEIDRPLYCSCLWMDCESQLQLQQQYRITEFGRSAEFPRIPWNSAETWKFHGNGQIPRLGSKFRGPRKTVVPSIYFTSHSRRQVSRADTGCLSLAASNIMLHSTLHILFKCCACIASSPKNVLRLNRSDIGPEWSSTMTWTCSNTDLHMSNMHRT